MLLPGDMFIRKEVNPVVEWTTFTVIAIDHGETAKPSEGRAARPARIMLLCEGPRIIVKDFSFLKNYIKVAGNDRVSGP